MMGGANRLLQKAIGMVVVPFLFVANTMSAQNNQELFFEYCTIHPQNECFDVVDGAVDTVGRNDDELGGGYTFCLDIEKIDGGFAPIRVMLVLDKSYSMCKNSGTCCVEGDGTDSCMMNDPEDKRIQAAIAFVDSLARKSPLSEVGVVIYDTKAITHQALPLNVQPNIDSVHEWINAASCKSAGYTDPITIGGAGLNKITATKATYLGLGLSEGLKTIDMNYTPNLARHIILLTDGAWDDASAGRSPGELIAAYKTSFPDRVVPTIHGVFLSNSELHLRHGFPSAGCSNSDMVILDSLNAATGLGGTKGQYFGGSTPQTVVANFDSLLKSVTIFEPQRLSGLIVTNTTNNTVRNHKTIDSISGTTDQEIRYQATIDNLPLEFGLNTLTIQRLIKKQGVETPETTTSTVSIFRTKKWITQINETEYQQFCTKDSTTISIAVSPPLAFINTPFNVNASIGLKEHFILDTVTARLFTQNADTLDNSTIALFHLENNLLTTAGTMEGVNADAAFSQDAALFGTYGLKSGSFRVPVGTISGDFAVEAWIHPSGATTGKEIFSCSAFSCKLTDDHFLSLSIGDKEIRSALSVDADNWSHIAIARMNGNVALFINGIDVSTITAFQGAITGELTVSAPAAGVLDEVRISTTHRLRQVDDGLLRFQIASVATPSWLISGSSITQQSILIAPDKWNSGNLQFGFSSPVPGNVVVNFQHRGTSQETQWSKNGNPVEVIVSTDVNITVTPPVSFINTSFTVNADIGTKESFLLGTVTARVFTRNSNVQDQNTIALLHLDNNVTNTAGNANVVNVDAVFSPDDALFGDDALKSGSFKVSVGTVSGDFAVEAWLKPSGTDTKQVVFSNGAFTLGISPDRHIYLFIGDKESTSTVTMTENSWSHIAVARNNGKIIIYINGLDASAPVASQEPFAGELTVSTPQGGLLDELRISTAHRLLANDDGSFRFDISSFASLTWTIDGIPANQQALTIAPEKWNNGNLHFEFSSPIPGKAVVNLQHQGSAPETQWSKNGNPVDIIVSTDLTITVTPKLSFVNTPFAVNATITQPTHFILDTVAVRVFTQNADTTDQYTVALFHLENNLVNTAGGDAEGVSADALYSHDDALFGNYAIKGGSFKVPVGMISGDFAVETWIKPSGSEGAKEIFSSNVFSLSITGDRYFTGIVDGKEIKSTLPIPENGWSHIAVVRSDGKIALFINGFCASASMVLQGTLSGILTISTPPASVLDEIRISSANRLRQDPDGSSAFEITTLETPSWFFNGAPVASQSPGYLRIAPDKWNNGNLQFGFSSPIPGKVIVNFQHRGTFAGTEWSKNGNPVEVAADLQGPYVLNSIYTRGDFGTDFDTFLVIFTEPVRCDSLKADIRPGASFEIYDSNKVKKPNIFEGAEYLDITCPSDPNNQMITEVRMKVKVMRDGIVPIKDSVCMIGRAVDASGNYPDTTKRGPIAFGPGNNYILHGMPNPYTNQPMTLKQEDMIRLGIPDDKIHSKLLLLQTREVLIAGNFVDGLPNYCDQSTVYDAVGNIVCTGLPVRQSRDDKLLYYIVWDGFNKYSRRAGSGGYLFRATIRYVNEEARKVPIQTKFLLSW